MSDPIKNFVRCIVSGTYSSADTAITLQTGEGAKMPQPSTDGAFDVTWYNSTDYPNASDDPLKEIVRVTARTTDALTITRAQQSTTATAKNVAGKVYLMVLTPTKAQSLPDVLVNSTEKTTPVDADLFGIIDSAASNILKKLTWANIKANLPSATPPNLLKNGNFINNSSNGYGATPDDWASSNANPIQGGIPALTKQNLIDILGVGTGDIEGLWPLNEASGNVLDLSDNAYNLTDTNTIGSSSDGLMALARDIEKASTEYATIADGSCPNLEIAGSQTWFAFIKPEDVVDSCIMGKASGTTYHLLQLEGSSNMQFFLSGLTTNTSVVSDVKLQTGKWYFVCGVYDSVNSKLKIWVNGIKKEVTASGSATDTNGSFNIGRTGGTSINYFDGLAQNACVLSVALTDNQVKKLFAATMYKGQKVRRATTNGYLYQQLPQNLVEQLRGKTVALRADLYQEVASTAQISIHQTMADGTTDETIISATDATTGSWLSKVATGTLEADVVTVEIRIKHSSSDGNTWFRNVSLYEGSTSLPYDHSKEDWSRFPRLLKMDIPAIISGYQFEEGKWFTWTPTLAVSGGTSPTYTDVFVNRFRICEKEVKFLLSWSNVAGGTAGAGVATLTFTLPAPISPNTSFTTNTRCIIGSGIGYESAGTEKSIYGLVTNGVSSGVNVSLYSFTPFGAFLGNDQSSTSRFISMNGFYEID